jgi:hypothetical protein
MFSDTILNVTLIVNVLEAILNVLYEILIALQAILNDSDVIINVTEPISNVKDLYYMLLLAMQGAELGHFPKLLVEAKTQRGFRCASISTKFCLVFVSNSNSWVLASTIA